MSTFWNNSIRPSTNRLRTLPLRALPLLALLLVGVVGMGAGGASAASRSQPFAYAVSGTATPIGPSTYVLAATGYSNPLGKISYAGNVTINSVDSVTGVITDTLTETLKAADGDTVTVTCHQIANPTNTPGVYRANDTWQVTGGTGHYSGATGSGTGHASINLNTDTVAKGEIGTITLPE